jgi:hypothetical protein
MLVDQDGVEKNCGGDGSRWCRWLEKEHEPPSAALVSVHVRRRGRNRLLQGHESLIVRKSPKSLDLEVDRCKIVLIQNRCM